MAEREDINFGEVTFRKLRDENGNILYAVGTTVPSAVAGYAKGCLFIKSDAADGVNSVYENIGTTLSCNFNLIGATAAGEITLANGKILLGGATNVAAEQTISGDITITNAGVASIGAGKVSKPELGYIAVAITVAAAAATGSSAADPLLVGGEILGIYPTGNQDQFVDNVVLNGDGSVTVTLAANATANNTFKVVVLKP